MNYTKRGFGFPSDIFGSRKCFCFGVLVLALFCSNAIAGSFRIATYNVENYLDQPTESRPRVKSAEAKAKVRESIRALNADVLVLEEMGGTNALLELRASLNPEVGYCTKANSPEI